MTQARLTPEQARRVERGKPLVDQLARSLARRLGPLTEDDLRSIGYEALVQCGLRYDPTFGTSFRSFAIYRVRGAMLDAARRSVPGLRQRSRALRVLQATQALLEQAQRYGGGDGPDPRALHERVAEAAEIVAQATTVVLLSHGSTDPERMPDDAYGDPEAVVHDVRLREHLRRTLLRCCSEEERALLTALYHDGLTMTELGERVGRNKSTISRRHAALLRRLSEQLRTEAQAMADAHAQAEAGPAG